MVAYERLISLVHLSFLVGSKMATISNWDLTDSAVQQPQLDRQGDGQQDRRQAHWIQIGLGTNKTFVQNMSAATDDGRCPAIAWLLSACSDQDRLCDVYGIAVEPVKRHANKWHMEANKLSNVTVLQACIGDADDAHAEIYVLDRVEHLLQQVPEQFLEELKWHLEYLENMSCLHRAHPHFDEYAAWIHEQFNLEVKVTAQPVEKWSWSTFVQKLNFCGCQVLVIDAEGHDASILRSMLKHCLNKPHELPELIQFETQGLCDICEEQRESELNIISSLLGFEYKLVCYSQHDSYLVYEPALQREQRLQDWMNTWICHECQKQGLPPYTSNKYGTYCDTCWAEWMKGSAKRSPCMADRNIIEVCCSVFNAHYALLLTNKDVVNLIMLSTHWHTSMKGVSQKKRHMEVIFKFLDPSRGYWNQDLIPTWFHPRHCPELSNHIIKCKDEQGNWIAPSITRHRGLHPWTSEELSELWSQFRRTWPKTWSQQRVTADGVTFSIGFEYPPLRMWRRWKPT